VNGARWRGRAAVVLENDSLRTVAVPSLGARVVSLLDRRSNREWLVQGDPPDTTAAVVAWAAEVAVFGGEQAFGWDECLPTVAPCADPLDAAALPLRDHGDLWGRPADVEPTDDGFVATWTSSRWPYVLRRTLRLDGPAVVASYELEVVGMGALPFLWSMHALLALEPGARLLVEGAESAVMTHGIGLGLAAAAEPIAWPEAVAADGRRVRLDEVRGIEVGQAAKLYLDAAKLSTVIARGVDGAELGFTWDRHTAPALGLWLDYGGWPPAERRHQVALEPTTSPDDDLAGAIAAGRARVVEPGRPLAWNVRLELGAGGG
jgi:hypothetical protein